MRQAGWVRSDLAWLQEEQGSTDEDGDEDALQATQRWLVCAAAAAEGARRRSGLWYVLPRQKLWWGGMVMKE